MRISLIDPRWREQRDIMLSKIRETTKGEGLGAFSARVGTQCWLPAVLMAALRLGAADPFTICPPPCSK